MSQKIQSITGMSDTLPEQVGLWQKLESTARQIFSCYGYHEIRTPIMEETQLFARGIGEETQVVSKEMYTFLDRGGDSVTLRPEGTAGVVRSYVQHSFAAKDPVSKFYYMGPMFRYERPQKGRLRQFHQIGAELIGIDSPLADAEVVIMMDRWVRALGIQNYTLAVNSLGTVAERQAYLQKLQCYFEPFKSLLGAEDQIRLAKNPLRIFDSKDEKTQKYCKDAPKLVQSLGEDSNRDFAIFQDALTRAGVKFEINPYIVRGLDYYEKTTFEFVSSDLGSQSAFAGGGRYNKLVAELGGAETPAVGFAAGCERMILLMEALQVGQIESTPTKGVYFVPFDPESQILCSSLMQQVRDVGVKAEMDYEIKSLKSQMRRANKLNFRFAVLIGENERKQGEVTLKDLVSGEQKSVKFEQLCGMVES